MSENKRAVTEIDLRHPAYRDVKSLDELEFDDSGDLVRKDRYQRAVRSLGVALYNARGVIWFVETLKEDLIDLIYHTKNFDLDREHIERVLSDPQSARNNFNHLGPGEYPTTLLLKDGSLLRGASVHIEETSSPDHGYHIRFAWRGQILNDDVLAMRMRNDEQPVLALMQDFESFIGTRTLSESAYREALDRLRTAPPRIEPKGGFKAPPVVDE